MISAVSYDLWDRLTQVDKTNLPTERYTYDHNGARISKTVGTATTNYLYSGPDIIAEYAND